MLSSILDKFNGNSGSVSAQGTNYLADALMKQKIGKFHS
jgi:hypothetical protein